MQRTFFVAEPLQSPHVVLKVCLVGTHVQLSQEML